MQSTRLLALCLSVVAATVGQAAWAQKTAHPAPAVVITPALASEVDASTPQKLIETAARAMMRDIEANRALYRKDPMQLYALVDRILLPYFDVDYAARLVLGRHWRAATPEQRKRFVEAFYRSLLTNYSDALVEFTSDRLKILPAAVEAGGQTASVRADVKRRNGEKVPVSYSMRLTPQGWKAWDVVIEGISYVKSFREDFGAEIDQKGLDAVLVRLEQQGGAPARKT
jgi:phospholipid transport system substrate-binding protein